MKKVVTIRIEPADWRRFRELVSKLKDAGVIGQSYTPTGIVRDYVEDFIRIDEEQLIKLSKDSGKENIERLRKWIKNLDD